MKTGFFIFVRSAPPESNTIFIDILEIYNINIVPNTIQSY